jgi:hypothetical protein
MISVARLKDHILNGDTKEMVSLLVRTLPHKIKMADAINVNETIKKNLIKRFVMVKELEATLIKKGLI